jgi:hypothetical protein
MLALGFVAGFAGSVIVVLFHAAGTSKIRLTSPVRKRKTCFQKQVPAT